LPSACYSTSSFFFYSFVHLLVLHSFPTRRSSDLSFRLLFIQNGPGFPKRCIFGEFFYIFIVQISCCAHKRLQTAFEFWLIGFGKDRKSTRLNSSHVSISYAVFCLKKKKTI